MPSSDRLSGGKFNKSCPPSDIERLIAAGSLKPGPGYYDPLPADTKGGGGVTMYYRPRGREQESRLKTATIPTTPIKNKKSTAIQAAPLPTQLILPKSKRRQRQPQQQQHQQHRRRRQSQLSAVVYR